MSVYDNKRNSRMVLSHTSQLSFTSVVHPSLDLVINSSSITFFNPEVRQVAHAPTLYSSEPKRLWFMFPRLDLAVFLQPLKIASIIRFPSASVIFPYASYFSPPCFPTRSLHILTHIMGYTRIRCL